MRYIVTLTSFFVKNWNFIKTIIIIALLSRILSHETEKIALIIELLAGLGFLLGENISQNHIAKSIENTNID
jgi:hypothetical protein